MSSRTYRVTEIVGTSPEGVDAAIRNGVARAARTLRHIDWFEVEQVRGHIEDGRVEHFQVTMKLRLPARGRRVRAAHGGAARTRAHRPRRRAAASRRSG